MGSYFIKWLTAESRLKRALVLALFPGILFASIAAAELVKGEAPNFTLKSLRGDNFKLSERRGEVVMLSFWASWCDPCKQGMPALNDIYLRYRDDGFTLLSINIEKDPGKAVKELRRLQVSFPVLMDTAHTVSEKYEVQEMPSTYLIDRDGNLRYTHHGIPAGFDDLILKQIRELMAE
ncbi:MAG TPA: TlpA disulfide reductase family protein [Gammaproteobacteria bacterium]